MVPIDSSIKNYPEDKLFSTVLYGSEDFNNDRIKKNQIYHFKYLVRSHRFNSPLFKLFFYDERGTFFWVSLSMLIFFLIPAFYCAYNMLKMIICCRSHDLIRITASQGPGLICVCIIRPNILRTYILSLYIYLYLFLYLKIGLLIKKTFILLLIS